MWEIAKSGWHKRAYPNKDEGVLSSTKEYEMIFFLWFLFSEQRNIFLKENVRIEHFTNTTSCLFYCSQIIDFFKKKLNKLPQKQYNQLSLFPIASQIIPQLYTTQNILIVG